MNKEQMTAKLRDVIETHRRKEIEQLCLGKGQYRTGSFQIDAILRTEESKYMETEDE